MNSIQPTYGDRVRYRLYSLGLQESVYISDPIGFDDDEKELSRDKKYFGIVRKTSDNLKFYQGFDDGRRNTNGGYDFILKVDKLGINEILYLIKEVRSNETNVYKEVYRTELDLSTLEKEVDKDNQRFCTIKGFEGGLDSLIKARKDQEIEIETTQTMDGKDISVIDNKTFQLKGRKINKYSKSIDRKTNDEVGQGIDFISLDEIYRSFIKTIKQSSSDDSINDILSIKEALTHTNGNVGDMFYAKADKDKILNIEFNFSLEYYPVIPAETSRIYFCYSVYENNDSYDFKEEKAINFYDTSNLQTEFKSKSKIIIDLKEGESLSCYFKIDNIIPTAFSSLFDIDYFSIIVQETTSMSPTQCKAYLMKDVFSKFIEVVSGRLAFRSNFFAEGGIGEYIAITDGGLVRNLPNWKLKTTLKDAIESFDATWNMSVGVERDGRSEYFRIEPIDYFFDNRTVLSLPNKIQNVKRKKAKEFIYSGVNLGYKGEGSYDNIQGLDKTNGIVNRTTIINRVDNVYDKISTYGTDDYEREIPRRLQYATNPNEDTKYDEKVMILDGKPSLSEVLQQRAASFEIASDRTDYDDFEEIPTGVFDAEGLTNGRWTPLAMTLRHGHWLRASLQEYKDSFLTFGSSNGNTGLKGVFKQLDSAPYLKGKEYSEKSNILASDLQGSLFYPEWIEFEHYVTNEMLDTLEGSSTIDGVKKKNFYGLIEFINEENKLDKGYLFSVKPNGNGKWKLLSYRKKI